MLTRIEIDGFKSFEDFTLDLGPFSVILGSNASGKSNLFDAIRLLSSLATHDLRHAFRNMRGEVPELFRRHPEPVETLSLAVEVLLQPKVEDHWGRQAELTHTRLRYKLVIARRRDERGLDRLNVVGEEVTPIFAKRDDWANSRVLSKSFRSSYLRYSRRSAFLVTHRELRGEPRFEIRQDGKAGRPFPTSAASATVLSTVTTAEFPHLFALREELRSWRFLQLDPTALRRPSPSFGVAEELEPDGSNLAYVLARIKAETASPDRPGGDLAEIAAELASIIPGVVDVEVIADQTNGATGSRELGSSREYRVDISLRGGIPFSSRVVSDGTLRVLALLTLLHDPLHRGLLLFEEPENGIHPARLKLLVDQLRKRVTDPAGRNVSAADPLTQIVINSHSPVVLSALVSSKEGVTPDVVFADVVSIVRPATASAFPTTRMRAVVPKDQGEFFPQDAAISRFEVETYLATANPEGI